MKAVICLLVHGSGLCCETALCVLAEHGSRSPDVFDEAEQTPAWDPASATAATTSHGIEIDWP